MFILCTQTDCVIWVESLSRCVSSVQHQTIKREHQLREDEICETKYIVYLYLTIISLQLFYKFKRTKTTHKSPVSSCTVSELHSLLIHVYCILQQSMVLKAKTEGPNKTSRCPVRYRALFFTLEKALYWWLIRLTDTILCFLHHSEIRFSWRVVLQSNYNFYSVTICHFCFCALF